MSDLLFEGISFNAENVASKTKEKFVEEMMPTKNFKGFDDPERKKLFEKAHSLCKEKVKNQSKTTEIDSGEKLKGSN